MNGDKIVNNRSFRAILAEIGTVGFIGVAFFVSIVAGMEFLRPGIVANYISSQAIFVTAFLCIGASLFAPSRQIRTVRQRVTYWVLAGVVTILITKAAWYYFEPIEDAHVGLTIATAMIIALLFVVMVKSDKMS